MSVERWASTVLRSTNWAITGTWRQCSGIHGSCDRVTETRKWSGPTCTMSPDTVSLLFYVLAMAKVLWWRVSNCDIVHSWRLCSAARLRDQATSTMTWYPIQSYNPDTEPTSHCPILVMPGAWLGSDKYTSLGHLFNSTRVRTCEVWFPWSPKTGDGRSIHSAIPPSPDMVSVLDSCAEGPDYQNPAESNQWRTKLILATTYPGARH